ncbi:MAG TPA: nucleoside 2-deoxyribosyltransferase [Methylomirabilota bacterium]|nr:nucleoside 2-deoxyribosyltransferase [Methylomirabilota bacterium]
MGAPRVYLAGPDVFLPEPAAMARAKQELCAAYGLVGVSSLDNEIDVSALPRRQAGLAIGAANEATIRSCQALVANLTPFRGPSADVGTAYELGFARALGLPVFAYTNAAGSFLQRTRAHARRVRKRRSGTLEDEHHMALEDFDLADNLMLAAAVHATGAAVVVGRVPARRRFTDLSAFEECLRLAARHLGVRGPDRARRSAAGR